MDDLKRLFSDFYNNPIDENATKVMEAMARHQIQAESTGTQPKPVYSYNPNVRCDRLMEQIQALFEKMDWNLGSFTVEEAHLNWMIEDLDYNRAFLILDANGFRLIADDGSLNFGEPNSDTLKGDFVLYEDPESLYNFLVANGIEGSEASA
jgi:hypothetical protein